MNSAGVGETVKRASYGLVTGLISHMSSCVTEFDFRLGDCVAGMSLLEAASIDLVVTSPPYNLGIRYGKFADTADRASYPRLVRRMGRADAPAAPA